MEAVEERRTFEKVMRNLERVGTILRAAFEELGVWMQTASAQQKRL